MADFDSLLARCDVLSKDVLRLARQGKKILVVTHIDADGLVSGEGTVKTHVARVLRKLDVRDRVQAVVLAYEAGVVEPGSR